MKGMPSMERPKAPKDDVYSRRVCHVGNANQRSDKPLGEHRNRFKGPFELRGGLIWRFASADCQQSTTPPTLTDYGRGRVVDTCRAVANDTDSVTARRRTAQRARRSTRPRVTTMLRAKAGGPSRRPRPQLVPSVKSLLQPRRTQGMH